MNELRECAGEAGHSHRPAVMSSESADFVVRRLFTAGLALGSCVRLLDDTCAKRVRSVISELDEIGRDVRRAPLRPGREEARPGAPAPDADPHRESLIAGMNHVLGEITGRLDALGRPGTVEDVPSPHLLDAVQSLERALAYLREVGAPACQFNSGAPLNRYSSLG